MRDDKRVAGGVSKEMNDHESGSDLEAPEEASNALRRKDIKRVDRQRRQPKRAKISTPITTDKGTSGANAAEEASSEEDHPATTTTTTLDSSRSAAGPSTSYRRLDPSLFAASFAAKPRHLLQADKEKAIIRDALTAGTTDHRKPNTKKRFGLVKGRDGQLMKNLKDGRTAVRVLEQKKRPETSSHYHREEVLAPPPRIDPSLALPTAKARAFRKQKLGLRARKEPTKAKEAATTIQRTEDDPLGLEDPDFIKGGKHARKQSPTSKPKSRSTLSDAGRHPYKTSTRHHQVPNFARSL